MTVNFADLFQTFYPPGSGRQYVNPSTGNDSNSGAIGSPKRTIGAAQSAVGGGGGIIWCADGVYSPFSLSGNYAPSARLLVMAQNIEGPTITCGGQHGISISGRGIGVYGFAITGDGDTGSFVYQKCILINGGCTYVSTWKNFVTKGCEAGIGAPSQGLITDYIDICYNTVVENGRWFQAAGSGISMYECRELDNNPGTHINVIGNRCYHNYNNSPGTANTDGNGIIIDDFTNTQYDHHDNANRVVVHQNLCVDNGGRGTHSPWTRTAWHSFNTAADNLWQINEGDSRGESAIGGSSSRAFGNVSWPSPTRRAHDETWSQYFHDTFGGTVLDNVALAGTYFGGDGSVRNRTTEGLNYFKNNTPTRAPRTDALADQWRPDGGSGAVEKITLSQADYDELSRWPDMFGDYRPARASGWAHGFAEAAGGGGGTGGLTITHPSLGTHGHLLTSSAQGTSPAGHARYLITYQMTAATGNGGGIIAASGIAYVPSGAAPAGGWPVITAAHGIMGTGLKDSEACSALFPNDTFENSCGPVDQWLNQGFAVVQTDYEGIFRGGDSNKSPVYVGSSIAHAMLDAFIAMAGLTSIKGVGAAVGFSQGGHAALICGEYMSYQPLITQFCCVGFDPWMSADTISGYYDGFGDTDPISQWVFGLKVGDPSLNTAVILNAGGQSVITTLDQQNPPYSIKAPAYGGGTNAFIADPTKAGSGWATACTLNTPGHTISVPSRCYSPQSGGLPYGDRWLTYATASGTQASRYVSSQNGHFVSQEYLNDAIPWVKARLSSSLPSANFTFVPTSPTAGQTVAFTDASLGQPNGWAWDFGDGSTSTVQHPSHAFSGVGSAPGGSTGLSDPGRKEVAFQLLSSAENSSLDWKAQYVYIQDINDGRGYTAGIGGFCSGTGDMLQVVDRYIVLKPTGNTLQPYRAALAAVNGTASHTGLGTPYTNAWVAAATNEPLFRQAQDEIRDELYFNPAVALAVADGLGALGQFCYFDHAILNGYDGMTAGIRTPVINAGTLPPSQGGNETTYLNAWLNRAIVQMDTDPAHSDHSRVIAQKKFLSEAKLSLQLPLAWTMYGDAFSITSVVPAYGSGASVVSYTVQLTVTNASGSSTTSKVVTVGAQVSGGGLTLQAEDATLTTAYPGDPYALHIVADNPGFVGSGYAGFFGQTNEKLVWSFTAPNGAGTYAITFRFRAIDAVTRTVWVNGVNRGTLSMPKNADAFTQNTWSDSSVISVALPAGANTVELRHAGPTYAGYADIDSASVSGGGTSATVPAASIRAVALVPGVSVATATVLNARPTPASVGAVAALPAVSHTRTATVVAAPVAVVAGIGAGLYGDIPIVHATVMASSIAVRAGVPLGDIEAMRMLAGRYRLLGNTRQRITG